MISFNSCCSKVRGETNEGRGGVVKYLRVLLHEFSEVVEETVLRSEEIELKVSLFAIHQVR